MGNYELAKDHVPGFEGEDWLPFNLWQLGESPIGGDPRIASLVRECAKTLSTKAARSIWESIAVKYEHPDSLSLQLPIKCAEFRYHWAHIPKRTPSEHKSHCQNLKRHADIVAVELDRYFTSIDEVELDSSDAAHAPNFTQILTEGEQDDAQLKIDWHHYGIAVAALAYVGSEKKLSFEEFRASLAPAANEEFWSLLIMDDRQQPGIVPSLPEMARRVGGLLSEGMDSPPIERPNSSNSERNYFVRRLLMFFDSATSGASPTLIAKITSMFFCEGISDNEVQQQRGRLPSGKLLDRLKK